ncbi:hypothetical protein GXW74_22725 [Roseomonas eburnea]|uniref:Uncharacterized protein n=1 Tax=Neoroseomonas eburnea TaxID=1346889 RepID=A0A9X9XHY2_9PROT|nr:hypothetical protein [Neoroseomonas eburnea]MBR0683318.1 hypothetical protein [Neoroseomonas eburnea]
METHRRPPVIDMTPEGDFRDPVPPQPGTPFDRLLARLGGTAILVAAAGGGLLLAGLAILAIGILVPLVIGAGAIGAASLWWRARRARSRGEVPPGQVRFVVIRR